MRRTRNLATMAFVGVVASAVPSAHADDRFRLEIEGGPAWQTRNDFAIPGDTGTRVDLATIESGPVVALRTTLTWNAGERWSLRLLAAPLRLKASFVPDAPVDFDGATFPAAEKVTARYRFDSYRLSWIYRFPPGRRWSFRAGFTAKIRSAEIGIEGRSISRAYDNVGFVPLLHGGLRFQARERLAFDLEADALAAPQGRAEDVILRADLQLSKTVSAYGGYRFVEGGADNDKVFTFAFLHYAVAGVRLHF
jgi:hypothetical protein